MSEQTSGPRIKEIRNFPDEGRVDVEYEGVDVEVYNEEAGLNELVTANMIVKMTHEGIIFDIVDPESGEIIRSAWQLIDDFVQMTH